MNCIKYSIALAIFFVLSGCKKDTNRVELPLIEINEEELITTFQVALFPLDGPGDTAVFEFRDVDGPGGNAPEPIDTIRLVHNSVYGCKLVLLNEATAPVDNLTNEIQDEGSDHLFCFEPSNASVSIVRTDSDGLYEIGICSSWSTGIQGLGQVRILLKHQPGIKDGTCAPGDTDLDVEFPFSVE